MNDQASNTTSRRLADDRGYGLAMFLIFAAAALIVTDAVALLALVGSWWMLGVAFAVHVAMTALVTLTIVGAMNGRGFAISDSRKTPQEPRLGSQPQARSEAVTAL
jgi:fatty acid desaturase